MSRPNLPHGIEKLYVQGFNDDETDYSEFSLPNFVAFHTQMPIEGQDGFKRFVLVTERNTEEETDSASNSGGFGTLLTHI